MILLEHMQKIILAIIVVLFALAVGIFLLVSSSIKEPEQPRDITKPDDIIITPAGDRLFYEGLVLRHPQGEEFVEGILGALDDLEDEDDINDLEAFLVMGKTLNLLEEKEEALEWYKKALLLDPTNLIALNNSANVYSDLGRYEESEAAWLAVLQAYPARVLAWRSLGYLYQFRLGKSSEEIETFFNRGFEATNDHPDLYNWLTSYFFEAGNNEKFAEYANRLNEIFRSQ